MKKLFTIIMAVCLMVGAFCITAFAANAPADDVVLRVSALKKDGTTVVIENYTAFEDGWNAAMELAVNSNELNKNDYARVIVDIYADWNANEDGEFTEDFFNGKGFNWDTIYFQPNVRMTLNLNDHTINRGLTEWEYNGEVIYIDKHADVIINDGTITGGFSCNGAGGIHINDGANVALNNVNVVGNQVEDDNGAGIAIYDGATLTMVNGKIADNKMTKSFQAMYFGGGVYIDDASASFYNVEFSNNTNLHENCTGDGIAIAMFDGSVVIDKCIFNYNGIKNPTTGIGKCNSIIYTSHSDLTIRNSSFSDNGYDGEVDNMTALIKYYMSTLTLEDCNFTNNKQTYILNCIGYSTLNVYNSNFKDNQSLVLYCPDSSESTFTNCEFDQGVPKDGFSSTFYNCRYGKTLHLIDCDSKDATFYSQNNVDFRGGLYNASIFGEGSLTMIIAFVALIGSCVSIFLVVYYNKRKKVFATDNNSEETEE